MSVISSRPKVSNTSEPIKDEACDSDKASGVATPTSTEQDDDIDGTGLVMRWREAQDQCLALLRENERRDLQSFKTPEQLESDLRERERNRSDRLINQLIKQIYPCLSSMQHLSFIFLASMQPRRVETAIVWGVLHLAIKASLSSSATLSRIVKMLNKIRNILARFSSFARALQDQKEMRHAIVDVFVALINFWVEAVRYLRRTPLEVLIMESSWPELNSKFNQAMEEMDNAVKHVYELASFANREDEVDKKKQVDSDVLSLIGIDDQSSTKFPCYDFPPSESEFIGREDELDTIDRYLDPALTLKTLQSFTISGIGGMGKTSLALAYAMRCKSRDVYDAIFLVRSQTAADLRNLFTQIALRLELFRASENADSDSNVILVKNWLGKTSKSCLLIYDNVDNTELLNKYLPPTCGSVLITTRFRHVAMKAPNNGYSLELNSLNAGESLSLFESSRHHYDPQVNLVVEKEETSEMLIEFDGLPLGIVQIAAYIGYRKMKISEFLIKYSKMASSIYRNNEGGRTSHSLATVWDMHFENVCKEPATKLLGLISILSPDEISIELFLPENSTIDTLYADFVDDEGALEESIDLLMRVALIKRKGNAISLHRLVQTAFIFSNFGLNSGGMQKAFDFCASLVSNKFPKFGGPKSLHGLWKECSKWFHHADAMVQLYKRMKGTKNNIVSSPDFDELLKNAAWYQYEIGELAYCLEFLETAYEACLDKNGTVYAYHCNTAGCVYYELNNLPLCRSSLEKSLNIRESKLEPDDLDFANTYSNFAKLLMSEMRLEEALTFCNMAVETRMRSGSAGAEYLAMSYMERGRIHFVGKEFQNAIVEYKTSDELFKQSGKSNGWLRGALLYAMGNLALAMHNLSEARQKYLDAHRICAELGPTQILISSIHFKLGLTATQTGDYDEALYMVLALGLIKANRLFSSQFKSALVIAEYRKSRADIARILYGHGMAIKRDQRSNALQRREGEDLIIKAKLLRMEVSIDLQIGVVNEKQNELDTYNDLLCGYFR